MALNRFYHQQNRSHLFGLDDDCFWTNSNATDPNGRDWMLMPVIPNLDRTDGTMNLLASSPGYEISQVTDETTGTALYRIAVDVPGVTASDIAVNVEHDGKVLHIAGGRKVTTDNGTSETKFEKRFTIGSHMDVDRMTANLADGVLTLTAPVKKIEPPVVHKIAITEEKPSNTEGK